MYPAAAIASAALARGLPVCELILEPSLSGASARVLGDVARTLPDLASRV